MEKADPDILGLLWSKAVETWGPYAFVLATMAVALWLARREIASLRDALAREKDKRLEDARTMILVAQNNTEVMRTRGENDALQTALIEVLGRKIAPAPPSPALPPPTPRE